MPSLVSRLAELTRHRDREQTDAMLADTLLQLLQPQMLALHRCVGEPPHARWLTCVSRGDCGPRFRRPPDFEQLPLLSSRPDWLQCLTGREPLELPGTPMVTLFPLLANGQAVAVLELHGPPLAGQITGRTVEAVLQLYGNFLALLDYGERDALTGLLNRKTFDDAVMQALLQPPGPPARRGDPRSPGAALHWLAILDIDHFKHVNDSFGHLIGDEVLLLLAGIMRSCFRSGDRLFRFGGEEFVVLLNAPDENGASAALQRLRAAVERFEFPQVGRVTLSIGFTVLRDTDTPADAVDRADRALYQAKSTGRNRVVGPTGMAQSGMPEERMHRGEVDLF
ncbi:GGDEF domain-containing protein [Azohydromonas australica]|uniref:GGDEF domain-containing protein n=1 Tax=Azohydromonas australica TaxID=364039 RepID=UPI000426F1D4|nr:GGDEF domain-containing protein [Azohydromonas australica]